MLPCIHSYIHRRACIHMYLQIYRNACMLTDIDAYILCMHAFVSTCIYEYTSTYIYIYIYIHTHQHKHEYIQICSYTHTHSQIYKHPSTHPFTHKGKCIHNYKKKKKIIEICMHTRPYKRVWSLRQVMPERAQPTTTVLNTKPLGSLQEEEENATIIASCGVPKQAQIKEKQGTSSTYEFAVNIN